MVPAQPAERNIPQQPDMMRQRLRNRLRLRKNTRHEKIMIAHHPHLHPTDARPLRDTYRYRLVGLKIRPLPLCRPGIPPLIELQRLPRILVKLRPGSSPRHRYMNTKSLDRLPERQWQPVTEISLVLPG